MDPIVIRTKVESDTLTLPELRPLVGREVTIHITELAGEGDFVDPAELFPGGDDGEPVPTLEEARAAAASFPGKLSDVVIAERGER